MAFENSHHRGPRPQFIKTATINRAIRETDRTGYDDGETRPVIVYGDIIRSWRALWWQSKSHIPVAHLEAELPSLSLGECRKDQLCFDRSSSLHLCPTSNSVNNMANEASPKAYIMS